MKLSFDWLKDYLYISESAEEVAKMLTQSGLEVAERALLEPLEGSLAGLVIGCITTCERHPGADKLSITLVDIGQDMPLRIVCGAPNVAVGQKVVVAPVGISLHSRAGTVLKIKKAKIRGVVSEGMLCAEDEIGLGSKHEGIMVLDTIWPPGTPASQAFNSHPDTIFDVDVTPNRGDACSHLGTARELGALLDRSVKYPSVEVFREGTPRLPIQVTVQVSDACPRYAGIAMHGVQVKQSPPWLSNRLRAIGLNPVNNIVDVTNFVMHELGQPLHAFDYDKIVGNQIVVQSLDPGTTFTTLDDKKRKLNGEELMVCDQVGGISMAGILGGQRTSVCTSTQNIFLESAYFAPTTIRKTAKQHAIRTDSAFRYERGTDPNMTVYALKRACLLIQETAHGKPASALIDLYPHKIADRSVMVYYENITRLLGIHIPKATIKAILQRLDIATQQEATDSFVALVPPYRVDVTREVDVIEEIIRIHGYDSIAVTGTLGSTYLAGSVRPVHNRSKRSIAELMATSGYHEIYTNPLTKSAYAALTENDAEQQPVAILNPLSEGLNVLRQSLLFGGLEAIASNINRRMTDLKLFEFGKIYRREEQQYIESDRLGVWLTGNIEAANWIRKTREATFQDLHAMLHKILQHLGISESTAQPIQCGVYQSGIQLWLGETLLLTAGRVHRDLLQCMSLHQTVFFADINWDVLKDKAKLVKQYQPVSRFPAVKRDISLVIDQSVTFEEVKRIIVQQDDQLIQNFTLFDVYRGAQIDQGKKAYALSFVLQRRDRTLDDKAIARTMSRLARAFEQYLGASIREQDA